MTAPRLLKPPLVAKVFMGCYRPATEPLKLREVGTAASFEITAARADGSYMGVLHGFRIQARWPQGWLRLQVLTDAFLPDPDEPELVVWWDRETTIWRVKPHRWRLAQRELELVLEREPSMDQRDVESLFRIVDRVQEDPGPPDIT